MKNDRLRKQYDEERVQRFKLVTSIATGYFCLPLYIPFWILDLVYVPHLKWQFLFLRATIVPMALLWSRAAKRSRTLLQTQFASSLGTLSNALPITIMIYLIGDIRSPYYAGLMMVSVGIGNFLPWTFRFFILQMALVYVPYLLVAVLLWTPDAPSTMAVHATFISGVILIASVIRYFGEKLTVKEFFMRVARDRMVENRDRVIKAKTAEAVRLERLSAQFSPQIVALIKNGELDINRPPEETRICAIIVDISGYTKACRRLSPRDIQAVLNFFYRACVQRFFKYDITFDKTVGDAVLGFSNHPLPRADYVQRVVQAGIEILEELERKQGEYARIWQAPFEAKIGISSGEADVGFFGDDASPKAYTAAGEVMNLVARITDCARPMQIVATPDVTRALAESADTKWNIFATEALGEFKLKGYEDAPKPLFSITGKKTSALNHLDLPTCPKGHGQLHLEQNEKQFFYFKCRTCEFEARGMDDLPPVIAKAA